ncbi:4482_t:CDS:2 [Dentiscutata erythropus]|uniref:4482_t:CDS:1 n=1 Tax=Dentiscutata erythropus TaxID=1348616 RepID=A0A9N9IV56_9GLOM|nr:4482_t:CDS:2 [Dentiscutata erythropus]
MSAITTKFVTDYKLTNEISLEELSQYAPEILKLLTDNKEKRCQARNHLIKGYGFSKEQVFALIPLQRIGRCKSQAPVPERPGLKAEEVNIYQVLDSTGSVEAIKEIAQHIIQDKLSEREVKAIFRILEKTSPDAVIALSHLSRFRKELRTLNALEKIISATLNLEVTRLSNKVQKECSEQHENEGIDFPDYFSLESVKERLNLYDVSNIPDKQALADFLPESGKPLLPSSLRKLGAVFASVAHGSKNASKANTYASEALRHLPDNHASPSKRYTIVNMRRRGEPYNQAKAFELFNEN